MKRKNEINNKKTNTNTFTDKILETDEQKIDSLISKVGFHQRKAHYIKETTKILKEKFKSDIPNTVEGLVSLPGVGPKMAYLAMLTAWNKYEKL